MLKILITSECLGVGSHWWDWYSIKWCGFCNIGLTNGWIGGSTKPGCHLCKLDKLLPMQETTSEQRGGGRSPVWDQSMLLTHHITWTPHCSVPYFKLLCPPEVAAAAHQHLLSSPCTVCLCMWAWPTLKSSSSSFHFVHIPSEFTIWFVSIFFVWWCYSASATPCFGSFIIFTTFKEVCV